MHNGAYDSISIYDGNSAFRYNLRSRPSEIGGINVLFHFTDSCTMIKQLQLISQLWRLLPVIAVYQLFIFTKFRVCTFLLVREFDGKSSKFNAFIIKLSNQIKVSISSIGNLDYIISREKIENIIYASDAKRITLT